jgi:hypothetical protein
MHKRNVPADVLPNEHSNKMEWVKPKQKQILFVHILMLLQLYSKYGVLLLVGSAGSLVMPLCVNFQRRKW